MDDEDFEFDDDDEAEAIQNRQEVARALAAKQQKVEAAPEAQEELTPARPKRKPMKAPLEDVAPQEEPPLDAETATDPEPKRKAKTPKKASEYELQHRRKEVLRFRMRGMNYQEIADKLEISVFTVKNDLAAVQKDNNERVKGFKQEHFVGECMVSYDDIIEEAWREYNTAMPGTKHRIASLNVLLAAQGDKLKALTDVGLVTKAVQEVKHTHVHELPWDEKLQQKVIQEMLNQSLTPQLQLPEHDPTHQPGKNIEIQEAELVPQAAPVTAPEPEAPLTEELGDKEDRVIRSMVAGGLGVDQAKQIVADAKDKMKKAVRDVTDQTMAAALKATDRLDS